MSKNQKKGVFPELTEEDLSHRLVKRPTCRSECANIPRPCPFVSCRYNLAVDAHGFHKARMLVDVTSDEFLDSGVSNCALDEAEKGPSTLVEVAKLYGAVTRERIRQIEVAAIRSFNKGLRGELRKELERGFESNEMSLSESMEAS